VARSPVTALSALSRPTLGVFRGIGAVAEHVTRKQLDALLADDIIDRVLPDTYRMTVVPPSEAQSLVAALLWAGNEAAADGRSAGSQYAFEGVRAAKPEIVVPQHVRRRHPDVDVRFAADMRRLMVRTHRGVRVTGPEATLVRLAYLLDTEAFEVACEDARRRRLTTVAALQRYVDRYGRRGQRGLGTLRAVLRELDPVHPSASTLEVKTRRLLTARGLTDFVREYPLAWNGRTYRFDFAFVAPRTIVETNGRRWHDDPSDYEHDHEKWSVPGRHGFKLVLATWDKVTKDPDGFVAELHATCAR